MKYLDISLNAVDLNLEIYTEGYLEVLKITDENYSYVVSRLNHIERELDILLEEVVEQNYIINCEYENHLKKALFIYWIGSILLSFSLPVIVINSLLALFLTKIGEVCYDYSKLKPIYKFMDKTIEVQKTIELNEKIKKI